MKLMRGLGTSRILSLDSRQCSRTQPHSVLQRMVLDKRGDERVLSIYWFIMFIIVAVAVVSGVARFYGAPMDVRIVEAELLADKVIDCVSIQGKLDSGFTALTD